MCHEASSSQCNNVAVVANAIMSVGSCYGRRMLTGTLRSEGIKISEMRVCEAVIEIDPENNQLRINDQVRRFNPVPYTAAHFGQKCHIDLNEKLVDYACLLEGAIDWYSGYLLDIRVIAKKNCLDVYDM